MKFFGLCSELGKPFLNCPQCGKTQRSGRREWESFSSGDKAWFMAWSFFGAVPMAIIWGVMGGTLGLLALHERIELDKPQFPMNVGTAAGAALALVVVGLIQWTRVKNSRLRSADVESGGHSFKEHWTTAFGNQFYMLLLCFVPPLLIAAGLVLFYK